MNRFAIIALVALGFAAQATAEPLPFNIDPNHSRIWFDVNHQGYSIMRGLFRDFGGNFNFDAQDPTASSVVGDVVDVVKNITGATPPPKLLHVTPDECALAPAREVTGSFYLRLTVDDRPGQLARVAETLSDHEVSLATVSQVLMEGRTAASLILTTHETNEHSIGMALEKLEKLPGVLETPVLFRMFDPNGKDLVK